MSERCSFSALKLKRRTGLLPIAATILFVLAFSAGCAAGPNDLKDTLDSSASVAGFWLGLWHGIILPFTFVISIFSNGINIYEVHNSGVWYNCGFLLGAAMISGGGGASARRR